MQVPRRQGTGTTAMNRTHVCDFKGFLLGTRTSGIKAELTPDLSLWALLGQPLLLQQRKCGFVALLGTVGCKPSVWLQGLSLKAGIKVDQA